MRKLFILTACALSAVLTMAQTAAHKPTLMVIPSDAWCIKNGYYTEVDNIGNIQKVPDYRKALQEDMNLKLAIATINDLMAEREFPLQDLEQTLKNIEQTNATMMAVISKEGNSMAESLYDKMTRTAKADIILELTWDITTQGPKNTLSYVLEGKDAYTNKSIGGANGTSTPSIAADVASLLREAVLANIDNFNNRLQMHFEDMFDKGREVTININVFENNAAGIDLESEVGPDQIELIEVIDDWMATNTIQARYTKQFSTENAASYTQVRIPLFKNNGNPMDTEQFARELRNLLRKEPYNIPVKVMPQGLGTCRLIIGEK